MPPGQSLEELTRLAQANPRDAELWHRLGRAFAEVQDRPRAVQALRRATQLDPSLVSAHERLGATLLAMGDAEAASLSIRVALTHNDGEPALHLGLAEALFRCRRLPEALRHVERASALAPREVEAHRLRARIHRELGNERDYLETLERVCSLDPTDARSAIALGARLARDQRREEALGVLSAAASLPLATAELHLELGQAFADASAPGPAVRAFREAIRINPDLAGAHLSLGLTLGKAGALKEAITSLKNAARLDPNDAEPHYHLGLTLRTAGQHREAASVLVKAAASAPEDDRIQRALADVLAHLREPSAAGADPPPTQPLPDDASDGGFTGDLAIFSLPELLEFLLNQRATGVLTVSSGDRRGTIELYDGMIAAVAYPNGKHQSERVTSNVVDRSTMFDVMSEHVRGALSTMIRWTNGSASFRRQERSDDRPELLVDPRWALLEAMRQSDEENR